MIPPSAPPTDDPIDRFVTGLRALQAPSAPRIEPVPSSKPRRLLSLALAAVAAVAAIGTIVLWPQPAMAAGWASVVASVGTSGPRHVREYEPDGRLAFELWRSGDRAARWYAPSWARRVQFEERSDGRRVYQFSDATVYKDYRPSANGRVVGTVQTKNSAMGFGEDGLPKGDLAEFVRVLAADVEEMTPGDPTRYRVRGRDARRVWLRDGTSKWMRPTFLVRVDDQRRIVETVADSGTRTVYDYPAVIPDSVFAPRPQKRIVPVIDVDAVQRTASARLRNGLGTERGVTVRLAALDKWGSVWLYWTGSPLERRFSSRGERRIRIVGVSTKPARGASINASLTAWNEHDGIGDHPTANLTGYGLEPTVPIGSRITVQIPGPRGIVTFRRVPVLRIATLYDIWSLIAPEPPTSTRTGSGRAGK